jgi:hypothetical protein
MTPEFLQGPKKSKGKLFLAAFPPGQGVSSVVLDALCADT